MSKKYRLLRDLPDTKAGAIAEWIESGNSYRMEKNVWVSPSRYHWLTKGSVECSPEWFEEVIDRIEVVDIRVSANNHLIIAVKGCDGAEVRIAAIKQAIEAVINDEPLYARSDVNTLIEDAFNAGRENCLYDNFQDYLKTLQPNTGKK